MSYTIHPAAELFPLIEGAEFDSLVADIQANGLIEPIAIQGNVVLDGRNRLRACEAAGIAPRYQEVPKGADAVRYIIGRNVHRRHLSTAQRSAIAAELANLNKLDNLKQSRTEGSNDPSTGTSIEEAAELMNVGTASVKRAKKVMRNDPAAHAAAKAGKKPKAPKAPRFSTVDIYHEAGLIPSAKSGQQSKVLNAEVERLAPGAIAAKDEVRVRTAAERIAMQRQPRAVAEAAKVAAEETKVAIPPSAQQRLEAAIRAHKRVLDAEFEERVQERVTQLLQETVLPKYVQFHPILIRSVLCLVR